MPTTVEQRWLREWMLSALRAAPGARRDLVALLRVDPYDEVVPYYRLVAAEDWAGLRRRASRQLNARRRSIGRAQLQRETLRVLLSDSDTARRFARCQRTV